MAEENKVTVIFEIDGKVYESQLSQKEAEAAAKGAAIGTKLAKGTEKGLQKGLKAIDIGFFTAGFTQVFNAIGKLAGSLGGIFSQAIDESKNQQDAIFNLNTALALAGDFSSGASRSMQDFADRLEETTVFGSDLTLEMLALSKNFGLSNDRAKDLVKAAGNLSAITGQDLRSSVDQLGQSLTGQVKSLAKFSPELKNVGVEALKSGAAIDLFNSRFAGAAEAKTKTFAGSLVVLKNQFGNLLEVLGDAVIKSPVVVELFKIISEQVARFTNSFKGLAVSRDIVGEIIVKLVQLGQALNAFVILPLEVTFNVVRTVFNGLRTYVQTAVFSLANAASKIVSLFAPSSELAQSLKVFAESSGDVLSSFADQTKESFLAIGNTDFSETVGTVLESVANRTTAALGKQKLAHEDFKNNTKTTLEEVSSMFKEFEANVNDAVNGIISSGLSSLGASLVQGGSAFGNFAKTAAGIMGDFFIKMGMTIISADLAIKALKASLLSFFGGAGVAAGIGLVVAGGALKALAGGPSSASAAGGGASSVATGVAGSVSSPSQAAALQPVEQASPETNVTVNVSGVVTDPRGTAKQIADLLKDGFKSSALNVSRMTV